MRFPTLRVESKTSLLRVCFAFATPLLRLPVWKVAWKKFEKIFLLQSEFALAFEKFFCLEVGMPEAITTKNFVFSLAELAQQLGISKPTLWRLKKNPANPGKNADGMFDVQAWDRFYAEVSAENATQMVLPKTARGALAEIRVQRETLTMEREALLLEKLRNRLVEVDKVRSRIQFHHERILKLVHEMLLGIPGLSPEQTDRLFEDFQINAHKLMQEVEKNEERELQN